MATSNSPAPSDTQSTRTSTTLLSLPVELHLMITAHLGPFDTYLFSLTHPYFSNLLNLPQLSFDELFTYETLSDTLRGRYLACACCLQLKHIQAFSIRNSTKARACGRVNAATRFCMKCALKKSSTCVADKGSDKKTEERLQAASSV